LFYAWSQCVSELQRLLVTSKINVLFIIRSIAPWTSTIASTSTPILPTSVVATSVSAVPTTPTNQPSSASILAISQGALTLVGVAAAYMLF
jgi:hypothetical protein